MLLFLDLPFYFNNIFKNWKHGIELKIIGNYNSINIRISRGICLPVCVKKGKNTDIRIPMS